MLARPAIFESVQGASLNFCYLQVGGGFLSGLAALTLAGTSNALASHPAETPSPGQWEPWFELGGYYNSRDDDGHGSFGTSRGEASVFVPIMGGQRRLLFSQLTAKFFQDDIQEGNLAVGYRQMTRSGFNFGAWIGADVRNTEIDNRFWQMSGGFEALSHNVDARLNWYGPATSPQSGVAGFAQVQLTGTQLLMTGGEEVALKGFDAEVGVRVPLEYANLDPKTFELRAYAGGFYFQDSAAGSDIKGVKGRLELRINDVISTIPGSQLTAEYEVSHDDYRDTRHEVGMRVRIPFNLASRPTTSLVSMSGQRRRMLDGVQRDTDIITARSKAEQVADNLTGVNFDRVAIVNNGGSVTTTSATAGASSLIIVNGTVAGAQAVQGNQTLQAGGSTIIVRGQRSGTTAPFTAPGAAGRLTTPAVDQDNLTLLGSNTHVNGLTIVGGGSAGIGDGIDVGSNRTNVFIVGTNISNTGGDGIDIDDNNQVTLTNVTTRNTDESGIDVNDDNRIAINGGSITNPDSDGVQINDDNTVTIAGLTITNMTDGDDGIDIHDGNTITLSQVTITGPGDDAIQLEDDNTLTITGSAFRNTDYGIYVDGANNVIAVSGTTFTNLSDDAILVDFFSSNTQLSVINSTFDTIGGDAFYVGGPTTLFISGSTVAGTIGSDVFDFDAAGTIASGSTGNVNNATIGDRLCEANGGGSFTGSIIFTDGTVLQDNVAPCD